MSVKSSLNQGVKKIGFRSFVLALITITIILSISACGQTVAKHTPTAAPTPTPAATIPAGESQQTLTINGLERTYLLHIPPGIDSGQPVPVVFALHGYDNEIYFEISDLVNMTGFNEIADKNGFVLVYPSGISGVWNTGICCGVAVENKVDEAGFFRKILTELGKQLTVDTKRVYATGFSLGGMLAFRLACEMSDTFAAITPVAGALTFSPCQPIQPVSIMQVHGKRDTSVPYAGGLGGFMTGITTFPAVEETLAAWAKLDGCAATATTTQETIAIHTSYAGCKDGSSVELYTIDGMGHSWPSQYVLPVSQMIWDFFKAHPKT
jgi:polyhydroxybutyrate depolymerase